VLGNHGRPNHIDHINIDLAALGCEELLVLGQRFGSALGALNDVDLNIGAYISHVFLSQGNVYFVLATNGPGDEGDRDFAIGAAVKITALCGNIGHQCDRHSEKQNNNQKTL